MIRSEYSILYGVISLIFLINAMQLSPEKLKEHALNWRLHIVVQGINLLVIPIIQTGEFGACAQADTGKGFFGSLDGPV